MELDKLVDDFANSVAQQKRSRDTKTANQHAAAYLAAFETLRAQGDPGREALARLLEDSRAELGSWPPRFCFDTVRLVRALC
jgi:hypothetical protein